MDLFNWVERGVKRFRWFDISLLKGSVFFFTLFLVTVWEEFRVLALSVHWGWYLGLGIILGIPLWIKFLK